MCSKPFSFDAVISSWASTEDRVIMGKTACRSYKGGLSTTNVEEILYDLNSIVQFMQILFQSNCNITALYGLQLKNYGTEA